MQQARLADVGLPVRATARKTATWASEKGTFTSGATMTDAATACCPACICCLWMLLPLVGWPVRTHNHNQGSSVNREEHIHCWAPMMAQSQYNKKCNMQDFMNDCRAEYVPMLSMPQMALSKAACSLAGLPVSTTYSLLSFFAAKCAMSYHFHSGLLAAYPTSGGTSHWGGGPCPPAQDTAPQCVPSSRCNTQPPTRLCAHETVTG